MASLSKNRLYGIVLPCLLVILTAVLWIDNHPKKYEWHVPVEGPAPLLYAKVPPKGVSNVRLVDAAARSGLKYRWHGEGPHPCDILQTIGNGCAFLDYDNDGNLDILLVGPAVALYKGDGKGRFIDVTRSTALDQVRGHLLGCCVGDIDNDGYDDIYLSAYRGGLLLHNDHGRRFINITAKSHLPAQPWGTSCAFADIDGDGRLDLFVGNYVKFDPDHSKRLCMINGVNISCGPAMYPGEYGNLFHNDGSSTFSDVTKRWGASNWGKTLGVAFADFDGSHHQSVYLADDEMAGQLLRNDGHRFKDVGRESGTAYDGHGAIHAGMGTDWGDYDNDGRVDLFAAAYRKEPKCIYHNLGGGLFEEQGEKLGIVPWSLAFVTFGAKWLDIDNDGWLDLMIANGHVQDNIHDVDRSASYRQPTQLFQNKQGSAFINISAMTGSDLQRDIVGRGLAIGDYDNDGRMDALVVDSEGAPVLLHNESKPVGNFLTLTLRGKKSNRDGYGATITVKAASVTQTQFCHSDGSYLSASDKRVHVGLGSAKSADLVQVRWPSGHVDTYYNVEGNRFYAVGEGTSPLMLTEH